MATKQHVYTGVDVPATTPTSLADHYVDTVNKKTYISVGTGSPADWQEIGSSAGGGLNVFEGTIDDTTGEISIPADTDVAIIKENATGSIAGLEIINLPDSINISSSHISLKIIFLINGTYGVTELQIKTAPGDKIVGNNKYWANDSTYSIMTPSMNAVFELVINKSIKDWGLVPVIQANTIDYVQPENKAHTPIAVHHKSGSNSPGIDIYWKTGNLFVQRDSFDTIEPDIVIRLPSTDYMPNFADGIPDILHRTVTVNSVNIPGTPNVIFDHQNVELNIYFDGDTVGALTVSIPLKRGMIFDLIFDHVEPAWILTTRSGGMDFV